MSRPPLPPFSAETAAQKARMAEDAWNTRDPARVALAYTTDSRWRNRSEFLQGRAAIEALCHIHHPLTGNFPSSPL
jgi:nuclear transport factor 2 (NTF2) superfamily protein